MDLYYADPAQHLIMTGRIYIDDLDRDLSDLSNISDLDHDLSDLSVRSVEACATVVVEACHSVVSYRRPANPGRKLFCPRRGEMCVTHTGTVIISAYLVPRTAYQSVRKYLVVELFGRATLRAACQAD